MIKVDAIAHIGITVDDLDRSVDFYTRNFGFKYLRSAHFQRPFFENNYSLYQLPPEKTECRTAVLVLPDQDVQLELFRFSGHLPAERVPWNRAGITHFALVVEDVDGLAEQMRQNGVEFCNEIGTRPDGGRWVFVRDPDRNLIEVMQPFRFS